MAYDGDVRVDYLNVAGTQVSIRYISRDINSRFGVNLDAATDQEIFNVLCGIVQAGFRTGSFLDAEQKPIFRGILVEYSNRLGLFTLTVNPLQVEGRFHVKINVSFMHDLEFETLRAALWHELGHIANQKKHGERVVRAELHDLLRKRLGVDIRDENYEEQVDRAVEREIQEILHKFKSSGAPFTNVPSELEKVERDIQHFCYILLSYFMNCIADIGVDFLAIMHRDFSFMKVYTDFAFRVSAVPRVKMESGSESAKQLTELWEFISPLANYPYHAAAYIRTPAPYSDAALNSRFRQYYDVAKAAEQRWINGLAGVSAENKRDLLIFHQLILKVAAKHAMYRFRYVRDPNFRHVIHNAVSIEQAKVAYRFVTRCFDKRIKKLP